MFIADEHEASAADVSGCGIDDGQCKSYGYGGVDCVAALFQDGYSGVGGVVVDADDHRVRGSDGFNAGLLGFNLRDGERGGGERSGEDESGETGGRLQDSGSGAGSGQKASSPLAGEVMIIRSGNRSPLGGVVSVSLYESIL
jgi:hypothetical protein